MWRSVEAEAARKGTALAEQAAGRLADTLMRDCPDLQVQRSGADVEIRGAALRARQADDARLRWLGRS